MNILNLFKNYFKNLFSKTSNQFNYTIPEEFNEEIPTPEDISKKLLSEGWKVKIRHLRHNLVNNTLTTKYDFLSKQNFPVLFWSDKEIISVFGGRTEAKLISPDGKVFEGFSVCSDKDQYSRKTGRAWAVHRAYQIYLANTTIDFMNSQTNSIGQ